MRSDKNRSNRYQSEEELWSRKFSESTEDQQKAPDSRVGRSKQKNKNEDGVSPWLTGAVLLLALLFIAPITYTLWLHNRDAADFDKENDPKIETVDQEKKEKADKKKQAAKKKKEAKKKAAAKKKAEEKKEKEQKAKEKKEKEAAEKRRQEEQAREEQQAAESNETQEEAPAQPEQPEEPAQPEQPEQPAAQGGTYTVQPGDTLYRIAVNHGKTVDELMAMNGLASPDISVGQVLQVE